MGVRLYVGNLSSGVDEYVIAQLFSKYGKIRRLDFLFHKTGPLKGQPRGYAFVEFETKDEADSAVLNLNGKLVRGKSITVSLASEQQHQDTHGDKHQSGALTGRGNVARRPNDAIKPTPISLLKSKAVSSSSTDKRIAALEAKLASIQKQKNVPQSNASTSKIDHKAAGLPEKPAFSAPPPEETKQL